MIGVGFLTSPMQAGASESCRDLNFPVTLTAVPQTMYGRLCVPTGGANTVQVLIPGGTYNSSYWDIAYSPETRSYRRAMNKAGYATVALDRLGTGRSSTPLSVLLTTITEADVVHQVIQQLRSGARGPQFSKVILAGHSFGSGMAIIEAATFHDVDAVLITGLAHRINLGGTIPVFAATLPAILDPKFAGSGHDPAYLTTLPNTRYDIFHKPGPKVDAAVAFDESTKDTSVHTQAIDLFSLGIILPYSRLIDKPVMIALGQDTVFCGPLATDCSSAAGIKRTESLYYSAAADLHTFALQGYGHAINYAPNATEYHNAVREWADRKVGT
ncbi:alpha/beta hydrolase [Kibdelosporangium aridum]|uniref:Alpha/beta hydrolase n=1 Tax=Kibdelosporangium aridum TaxID=2030 RepID=A0A428Z2M6_KIBAR|nr:alpha/beta fold hydrolase [Kibdelosporangium aridum]RSM79976.1 alpha/beta hydrolase [Kibdelosporangium aridum]